MDYKIFLLVWFSFIVVMLIKSFIAYRNQMIIVDAIFKYNSDVITHHEFDKIISYQFVESYTKTLFRFWDWGYKHVVPPEIFEVIKPYIHKK